MIAANLAQKSRSETCALTPAMVADDWLFSSSSSVLCPKPATVSATVGSGIVASTGVERWSKSRDSAVVSATARPGQSHRSRQIGVLPRGQQKDGGRSGLVGLSIAKPSVYENRGLAYQTYSRLNIHASRATASSVPPSELSPNRAPNWSWAMTFITGKSCHPKGFLDNQYGIFRRLNNNALVNIARHQNFKMVWAKYVARSSRKLSQSSAKVSAGNKIKNSELSPLTADNHSQIPKVLSTIRSPIKGGVCQVTHRSRIAVPAARKEVGNQFYLGDLITTNGVLNEGDQCLPSTVEFPYQSRVLRVTHRSRIAVPAARKEVSNKFYLGNSTTPFFGSSSQIPKVLSMVDSLPSVCIRTWQSTPFNAVRAANEACHGNSLVRESAAFIRAIRQLKVELKEML